MKNKYILIFLCLGITYSTTAQRPNSLSVAQQIYNIAFPSSFRTTSLQCNPNAILNGCNYIQNNQFTTNITPYNIINPFANGEVIGWGSSHGTPQLWYSTPLMSVPSIPFGFGNFGLMAFGEDATLISEGMVTKIPPLTIGNKYTFSFSERFAFLSGTNLAEFNVYLIKCADYENFNLSSETIPPIPLNSQQIYCETNCSNTTNWAQIVTNFIANDTYNMVWIFPKTTFGSNVSGQAFFGKPELVNASNISVSMSPSVPTPGNCIVTLIPSGCLINNLEVVWTGPNGQTYNSLTHVVNTDDPSNVGIWTATQFIPNISATNNSCGLPFSVSVNINVPSCNAPCINLPLIH